MTESLTTCSTHSHWATLSLGNSKFCKVRIFILAHHQFDHKKSFVKPNEKVGKYRLENAGLTAVLGRWRSRTQLFQVYNFPQTAAAEAAGQTQNKHWLFHCFCLLATSLGNFFYILKVVEILDLILVVKIANTAWLPLFPGHALRTPHQLGLKA